MNKPGINDKCGFCNHNFSVHYETFGATKQGCSADDQREGSCNCHGFMIKYVSPRTATSHADPREYMDQQYER